MLPSALHTMMAYDDQLSLTRDRTYPACIPHVHVSHMYLACTQHVSRLTSEDIHVSCMYPACLLHSCISDTSLAGCIFETCITHHVSTHMYMYLNMYLRCISHLYLVCIWRHPPTYDIKHNRTQPHAYLGTRCRDPSHTVCCEPNWKGCLRASF